MRYSNLFILPALCLPVFFCHANDALKNQMLSHVEKILVVDSIAVDKDAFFKHYRIHPSAGAVVSADEVADFLGNTSFPDNFVGTPFTGFTNEFNDYMIWAHEDTTGYLRLAESVRLIDGSWSTPRFAPTVLNFGAQADDDDPVDANTAFPFMADDGQTLYFAADNGASLGGYDIFIATKDPLDGNYLIPRNIGMPFNSEFDDYMLVLDQQTGVGWWATDRNQLEDMITIYVYKIADQRVNVDPSDEFLPNYASLLGWEELADDEQLELRRKLRDDIAGIKIADFRAPEFTLPVSNGGVYHYFSDFRNKEAAGLMKKYLKESADLEKDKSELSSLRGQYHNRPDEGLGSRIRTLEEKVRSAESSLSKLLSNIYKAELK